MGLKHRGIRLLVERAVAVLLLAARSAAHSGSRATDFNGANRRKCDQRILLWIATTPRSRPAVSFSTRRVPRPQPGDHAELWERVIRQLRAKSMPPVGNPRPDDATYAQFRTYLETELDRAAAAKPNPGELPNLHRLTRTEYRNAIRDLLALDNLPKEMDFTLLLPADNSASGFDNIADLLYISPATMERYLDAATKISRLAVGDPQIPVMVNIHHLPLAGAAGLARRGFALRHTRRHGHPQLLPARRRIRY